MLNKIQSKTINDSIEKLYDLRTVKDIENIIRIEDFN